jgi:hypothetical protein
LSRRGSHSKTICAFNVHIHTILCYDVIVKHTKGRCDSSAA